MSAALRRLRLPLCLLALVLAPTGCGRQAGPPPIARGVPCANCGMTVNDLHFACERRVGRDWRVYDAIECLLDDARGQAAAPAWLADYDARTLHATDSLWVVHGSFPSPMGGGYAAFLDRTAADAVAAKTGGSVRRYADWLRPEGAR